jgi:hypothetical protein
MPESAMVEMLLIKGSPERSSSPHLMHALHKQASISTAEFRRSGQPVVYHSAEAAAAPILPMNLRGRRRY